MTESHSYVCKSILQMCIQFQTEGHRQKCILNSLQDTFNEIFTFSVTVHL